jgi:hypothetical protein
MPVTNQAISLYCIIEKLGGGGRSPGPASEPYSGPGAATDIE